MLKEKSVTYHLDDQVAVITFDDGKVNVLSFKVLEEFRAALDRAESEAKALVIVGREGKFCAGFDLEVMRPFDAGTARLISAGAELVFRIYMFPIPVVFAVTGHTIAAGAVLLMTADYRIGAQGDFKIGLNEVAIGMPLPQFVLRIARAQLNRKHLTEATLFAQIFSPDEALEVGYLNQLLEAKSLKKAAMDRALALAQGLNAHAFAKTKQAAREDLLLDFQKALKADLAQFPSE